MSAWSSRSGFAVGAILVFGALAPHAHAQQQQLEPLPPPERARPSPPADPGSTPSQNDDRVPSDGGAPHAAEIPPSTAPKNASGKDFRTTFKGSAGLQYAQVHGVPITGGRLRLGVGAQNDARAFYAMATMLLGSTEEGLRTWDLRGSLSADLLRLGILRLGGDLEMGYLVVRRATVDARMWALGLGAGVHASIDAYQFGARDDHAVFIEAKLDAHLHFGTAFMWGPSILGGIRY